MTAAVIRVPLGYDAEHNVYTAVAAVPDVGRACPLLRPDAFELRPVNQDGYAWSDEQIAHDGIAVSGVTGRNPEEPGRPTGVCVHQRVDDCRGLLLRHLKSVARVVHRMGQRIAGHNASPSVGADTPTVGDGRARAG